MSATIYDWKLKRIDEAMSEPLVTVSNLGSLSGSRAVGQSLDCKTCTASAAPLR